MTHSPGLLRKSHEGAIALGLLIALISTLLVSWPALSGPFLFDDFPNLEQLNTLDGRLDLASLANFASQYRSQPGRPLSMLSFVLNDFAWPSSPLPFKYTNLQIHLLVGVLVFGFGRTLAKTSGNSLKRSNFIALLLASAWLLHPLQLSTSMLVVQRMTQLSAMFSIIGLWGYTVIAHRAHRPLMAFMAIAVLGTSTVCSVLCKESGALSPLLAIVINSTLLRSKLTGLPDSSRKILQWGTILPVLALVFAIAWRWDGVTTYGSREFTMYERVLTEARVLVEYLTKIIVPTLHGGGIYHDDFPISRGLLAPWTTLAAASLVIGLIVAAILGRAKWPSFSFAVLWFFAGHLLESTIFPLEIYFEHRNYLPMVGILFAMSYWTVSAAQRRKIVIAIAVGWIAFAAWLTSVEAPIWGNSDALAAIWAIEHPDSARAVQEVAANQYRHGRNDDAAATLMDGYDRGVRGSDFPLQVLLLACTVHDKEMATRARAPLAESLESSEFNRATLVTLRKFREQVQRDACEEILTEDEWLSLTSILLANPNFDHGEAAGYLYIERAYLYAHRRDLNSTMLALEEAWKENPTPELAQLMSVTLVSAGLYDEAEHWAKQALDYKVPGVRGLFSQDEFQSLRLLEAIRAKRARSGPTSRSQEQPTHPSRG